MAARPRSAVRHPARGAGGWSAEGSAGTSAGVVIGLCEKAQQQARVAQALQIRAQTGFPDWVEVDEKKFSGVLKSLPERGDILPDINESLVVELYSK